jgi:hypothetical protein
MKESTVPTDVLPAKKLMTIMQLKQNIVKNGGEVLFGEIRE